MLRLDPELVAALIAEKERARGCRVRLLVEVGGCLVDVSPWWCVGDRQVLPVRVHLEESWLPVGKTGEVVELRRLGRRLEFRLRRDGWRSRLKDGAGRVFGGGAGALRVERWRLVALSLDRVELEREERR